MEYRLVLSIFTLIFPHTEWKSTLYPRGWITIACVLIKRKKWKALLHPRPAPGPPSGARSLRRLRRAPGWALPARIGDARAGLSSLRSSACPLVPGGVQVKNLDPRAAAPEPAHCAWTRQGSPRPQAHLEVTERGAADAPGWFGPSVFIHDWISFSLVCLFPRHSWGLKVAFGSAFLSSLEEVEVRELEWCSLYNDFLL